MIFDIFIKMKLGFFPYNIVRCIKITVCASLSLNKKKQELNTNKIVKNKI